MSEKYYVDSAIWRDLHENRRDKFRPLGEWAFELFRQIGISKGKILYSDLVVKESSVAYDEEVINKLFENKAGLLEKVEIKESQVKEAAKLSKKRNIPFGDVLHGVVARDNDAIMVTRDNHFKELQDVVCVKKPEELL